MDDAASSEEIAPAAATDAATTQDEANPQQRADADVTDLLTAELDAAVAAAAPQRTDSTDVLTAELDALLDGLGHEYWRFRGGEGIFAHTTRAARPASCPRRRP